MKFLCLLLCIACIACEKETLPVTETIAPPPLASNYVTYTIRKGEQSSDHAPLELLDVHELRFNVKFDSTAIYQTLDPVNQLDVNKLYGFADNNAHHQQFSARFGWRYLNNKLTLHGYVYNNANRIINDLAEIQIGRAYDCSIKIIGNKYKFTVDSTSLEMPRTATTATSSGYKLFPFFGGDELAPHDIRIYIRQQ